MKFKEFGIKKDILNAIRKAGYEEATPIQEKSIPVIMEGHDMIGLAQTGTGKTAAFALPILNSIEYRKKPRVRALILAPTRELAIQTFENFKKYGRYIDLRTVCLYGGAKKGNQISHLKRGADIIIATPGRLLDLQNEGFVKLDQVEYFVLDEADRMLDMGFIPDIRNINAMLPENRQMIMFSATMERAVENLAMEMLTNPVRIQVAAQNNAADTVDQKLIFTEGANKDIILTTFLKKEINSEENRALPRKERKNAIVFTRTKRGADRLNKALKQHGLMSVAIHGDKSQGQRKDALDRFRSGQVSILVATDVAARGLDIPKLNYVFNYDLPEESDNYVHRIGRTGRAGESGVAYTLCCEDELGLLYEIEKLIGKEIPETETKWSISLERKKKPSFDPRKNRRGRGGYKGNNNRRNNKDGKARHSHDSRKPHKERKNFKKEEQSNQKFTKNKNNGNKKPAIKFSRKLNERKQNQK